MVAQANSRLNLIHILATRTTRTEGIPLIIRRVDHNLDRIIDGRRNKYRGKRGLAFVVGIEGRKTHHTMYAILALEVAVGVVAVDLQRAGFHSHLVARLVIHHTVLIAVSIAPAGVHTQQHRGPIECLRAASTGVDIHNGAHLILLRAKHIAQFESLDKLHRMGIVLLHLGLGRELGCHKFGHQLQLLNSLTHSVIILNPRLDGRHLA